jgi:hypothetical protein
MTIQPLAVAEEFSPYRRNGITCITRTGCIRYWSRAALLANRRQRRDYSQLLLKNMVFLYNITELVQPKVGKDDNGSEGT